MSAPCLVLAARLSAWAVFSAGTPTTVILMFGHFFSKDLTARLLNARLAASCEIQFCHFNVTFEPVPQAAVACSFFAAAPEAPVKSKSTVTTASSFTRTFTVPPCSPEWVVRMSRYPSGT